MPSDRDQDLLRQTKNFWEFFLAQTVLWKQTALCYTAVCIFKLKCWDIIKMSAQFPGYLINTGDIVLGSVSGLMSVASVLAKNQFKDNPPKCKSSAAWQEQNGDTLPSSHFPQSMHEI